VEADFPAVDDFLIPAAVPNASLKVSLADDGAGKAGGLLFPRRISWPMRTLLKFLARILTCSSWRQLYLFRFSAEIPCTESHRLHVPWAVRQTPQLARHFYVEVARKVVSSMSAGNQADDVMIGDLSTDT
jgi:hypothetical protein